MFIEGKVVASNSLPEPRKKRTDDSDLENNYMSSSESSDDEINTEKLQIYKSGDSFGQECFKDDEYRL